VSKNSDGSCSRLGACFTYNCTCYPTPSITPVAPVEGEPDVVARITEYLNNGGLFNPELMDHSKVRDLLIDCRKHIDTLIARLKEQERETLIAIQKGKDAVEIVAQRREWEAVTEEIAIMPTPSAFVEYMERNYPPRTVISDIGWHTPKIWRAALHAMRAALTAARGGE